MSRVRVRVHLWRSNIRAKVRVTVTMDKAYSDIIHAVGRGEVLEIQQL